MWLLSAVSIVVLLNRIDGIVHGKLYNYGLQFSPSWATEYWVFVWLMYVCLALPATLTVVTFGLDLFGKGKDDRPAQAAKATPSNGQIQTYSGNNMVVSCPSCRKMFHKPLTMLDFGTGKAKLVNVCPYCNHILGGAYEKKPDSIQIVEPEEKEAQ
jgi:hypothetical protein